MNLRVDLKNTNISQEAILGKRQDAKEALTTLFSGTLDFTGWVKNPAEITEEQLSDVKASAKEITESSDYFIVLGVGGSYMGAKAVLDMLPTNSKTEVLFAGYNFSGRYLQEILNTIEGHDFSICVVSKSGSTTETLSAYGIFKEKMLAKYGPEETAKRTYVVTETRSNYLFDQATEEGCRIFDLAVDIGGRYSVLTPVGLLPLAVAGLDIDALVAGAASLANEESFDGDALDYAITRQLLASEGKTTEIFEVFDPYLAFFGEWLKQLFGESEGKEGIGIFPTSLVFSRDLHSMGQFLQQGNPIFFETFLTVDEPDVDVAIPDSAMPPFAGKTIQQINTCAEKGVLDAHVSAGTPCISLYLPKLNEYNIGELIYWFEMQCAVSATLSGIDPFNQPGVEDYKKGMRYYINQL